MSRNLGDTVCGFCDGEVKLVEALRPITPNDAGTHYDEFKNMIVANAECVDCRAKYLAWVGNIPHHQTSHLPCKTGAMLYDLSYRSTFKDEPGPADLPDYEIEIVRKRKPWPHRCTCCNTKVNTNQGGVCRACEEIALLATKALNSRTPPENVVGEHERQVRNLTMNLNLAAMIPLVARRLGELPEVHQRLDAAYRLGAQPADVRDLARELLPLPLPPPPESL